MKAWVVVGCLTLAAAAWVADTVADLVRIWFVYTVWQALDALSR